MSWRIEIPNRGADQPIVDALFDLSAISDPEDHAVAQHLLCEAAENGVRTVGEVLDRLERADAAERRGILDSARIAVGLPTTDDVAAHNAFEAANQPGVLRARRNREASLRIGSGGGYELIDPAEIERERRRDALLAEEDRARREQRAVDARERAAARQAADQAWRPRGPGWDL